MDRQKRKLSKIQRLIGITEVDKQRKDALLNKNIIRQNFVRSRVTKGKKAGKTIKTNEKSLPNQLLCSIVQVPDWFEKLTIPDITVILLINEPLSKIHENLEPFLNCDCEIIYLDATKDQDACDSIFKVWENKSTINGIGKILKLKKPQDIVPAINSAVELANGKSVIFIDGKLQIHQSFFKNLSKLLRDSNIGIVIPKFNNLNHSVSWNKNKNCLVLDSSSNEEIEIAYFPCFAIQKDFYQQLQGMDESYRDLAYGLSDLSMKCYQAGKSIDVCSKSNCISTYDFAIFNTENDKNKFFKNYISNMIYPRFEKCYRPKKEMALPSKKDIVVYTAITNKTNGYDILKELPTTVRNIDYVSFLETPIPNTTWKFEQINKSFKEPNRNAKIHKILSHKYFPDKMYSLWIDGSVTIEFQFSIEKLVQLYLSDCDLALFEHSERHCIFEEANVCINRRLDNPEIIRKQINRYHQEGYPANAGLGECTILLRRHTPEIIEFNECWWQEILNGSKRDQISFQYVINKLQLKHRYFPGHLRCTNKLFKRHFHANQK
jgi:hypothetical protein